MDIYLLTGLIIIMAYSGVLMGVCQWLALVKYPNKRIRPPRPNRVNLFKKIITVSSNGMIAVAMIIGALYLGGDALISTSEASGLTIFGQALAVLLLYDFFYYFLHRGMHHPFIMKKIHGLHHYVRYPTAFESIYIHPLEGIAAITLLILSLAIFGPISATAFLIVFFVYSTVNILVHVNLKFDHPLFKLSNYWAIRHDIHHGTQLNRNYASIFPFWDMMFGTYA